MFRPPYPCFGSFGAVEYCPSEELDRKCKRRKGELPYVFDSKRMGAITLNASTAEKFTIAPSIGLMTAVSTPSNIAFTDIT